MSATLVRALRREIATRDAFLARVTDELDRRIAALARGDEAGLRALARELAIIAGRLDARRPARENVDVASLVARTLDAARRRESAPAIELVCEGDTRAFLDPAHVETMLAELLSNAWKYGGGRPIVVRVEGRNDRIRIVVDDEGPGIARSARRGARFVRGDGAHARPGFGVGVWLVRALARESGGELRLSRRREGGTRAAITLPRR